LGLKTEQRNHREQIQQFEYMKNIEIRDYAKIEHIIFKNVFFIKFEKLQSRPKCWRLATTWNIYTKSVNLIYLLTHKI